MTSMLSCLYSNKTASHFLKKLWSAVTLTSYASDTRYPGFDNPVTKDEYDKAIILAHTILRWVEKQIG
jgi:hypothetical protein